MRLKIILNKFKINYTNETWNNLKQIIQIRLKII